MNGMTSWEMHDSIMDSAPEARADNFLLWATLRFNPDMYQTLGYPETHWGDKAYQVGYGG